MCSRKTWNDQQYVSKCVITLLFCSYLWEVWTWFLEFCADMGFITHVRESVQLWIVFEVIPSCLEPHMWQAVTTKSDALFLFDGLNRGDWLSLKPVRVSFLPWKRKTSCMKTENWTGENAFKDLFSCFLELVLSLGHSVPSG